MERAENKGGKSHKYDKLVAENQEFQQIIEQQNARVKELTLESLTSDQISHEVTLLRHVLEDKNKKL